VLYEVQGPGGNGGTASTAGAGTARGGPGGAGAFVRGFTTAAVLGSTETITVPAGGATTNASFGALAIAGYGTAGGNVTTTSIGSKGAGGAPSGTAYDLGITGESGSPVLVNEGPGTVGGKSHFGSFGKGGNGEVATSGGSLGGREDGGDAKVIVTEFFVD